MVAFRAVGDDGVDADAVAVKINEADIDIGFRRGRVAKGAANLTIVGRFNVLMMKSCALTSSSRELT